MKTYFKHASLGIGFALLAACPIQNKAETPDLNKQLFDAIQNKELGTIKQLLQKDAGLIEARDENRRTALMWALVLNPMNTNIRRDIVDLLINNKSDVNAEDRYGATVLMTAAENAGYADSEEIIKNLLAKLAKDAKTTINKRDKQEGRTALMKALKQVEGIQMRARKEANYIKDNPDVLKYYQNAIKLLIESGANVNIADKDANVPLILAAEMGLKDIVELLIKKGAKINIDAQGNKVKNKRGLTALMSALLFRPGNTNTRKEIVKMLLGESDVNAKDENGETALTLAAEGAGAADSKEIIKMLLDKGAKITDEQGGMALIKALEQADFAKDKPEILQHHQNAITLLIESGANVNTADNSMKATPLMLAAEMGLKDIVKLLVGKGADVKAADKFGRTALMRALVFRPGNTNTRNEIVDLLLGGSNVNAKNESQETALMLAAEIAGYADSKEIIQRLLDNGAKTTINQQNLQGKTALIKALEQAIFFKDKPDILKHYQNAIELLIGSGADTTTLKDQSGKTASNYAEDYAKDIPAIADIIRKAKK